MPVLMERSDNLGSVGVSCSADKNDPRTINTSPLLIGMSTGPDIEERVAEREDSFSIVIGNGSEPRDIHVAGNQHTGNALARLQRVFPVRRPACSSRSLIRPRRPGPPPLQADSTGVANRRQKVSSWNPEKTEA